MIIVSGQTHVCMRYEYVCECVHKCAHVCVPVCNIFLYVHAHMRRHMYTRVPAYVHVVHVPLCVRVWMCLHTCARVYVHAYVEYSYSHLEI